MTRAEIEGSIQELYIGILGRAGDYSGLKFWADAIESGSLSLENTRASFASPNQPEYWNIYGGLSNGALVDKVYQNFLERSPDAGGRAFWLSELDSGRVGAEFFISSVASGAKSGASIDATVLASKVESAQYFTAKTKDVSWTIGNFSASAKAAVDNVTADASTLSAAKSVTDGYLPAALPAQPPRTVYNDKLTDAGDSILSPTAISANTSVGGVLGLRYSATKTDVADYFTFTADKTGILHFSQYGDRKVSVAVATYTVHLLDNLKTQFQYPDAWLGYEGVAQVFAGEHVNIQLTGSGAPTAGSGAAFTDGLAYGFSFYIA